MERREYWQGKKLVVGISRPGGSGCAEGPCTSRPESCLRQAYRLLGEAWIAASCIRFISQVQFTSPPYPNNLMQGSLMLLPHGRSLERRRQTDRAVV